MDQTSSSLQSSKWLAAARVLHEAVRAKRAAVGKQTKSFADWVDLQRYTGSTLDIGTSGRLLGQSSCCSCPRGRRRRRRRRR